MATKKLNKISIKPMGNAQAIASTLGIKESDSQNVQSVEDKIIGISETEEDNQITEPQNHLKTLAIKNKSSKYQTKQNSAGSSKGELGKSEIYPKYKRTENLTNETDLPLMIEIKRRLPGKELFVLSLLYVQKNKRELVQMTVNSMMTLYTSVFNDVIKDDTVRRSLKRLSDSALIKTISIPGNNTGYVYEIKDLLESNVLTKDEKEEFIELVVFVESKLSLNR
ncbi:MAG: hypothetical protein H7Z37_10230 [Pyrinomonadaceae bacterium]|nr:hypothetical protein [Pyrinomonadaceae bacterium]